MLRRLAAFVAALGLLIVVAAPALAADITNQLPISSDNASYQGDCDAFPNLQTGQVGWLFVINQSSTDTQILTLQFQNAGTVTVSSPTTVQDSYNLHYAVVTPTADTLVAASSSGDGNLVLSGICNGGPPPVVPEAPASALLVLAAGAAALGFVAYRMRRSGSAA